MRVLCIVIQTREMCQLGSLCYAWIHPSGLSCRPCVLSEPGYISQGGVTDDLVPLIDGELTGYDGGSHSMRSSRISKRYRR
jgi:hypothetical protein